MYNPATSDPFKIVDLFAGPGGLDVAARELDITATGIECDPDACATRGEAGLKTTEGDVRDFGPDHSPDANVLAGGPPCQTFTVAGNGAGRRALDQVLDFAKRMAECKDRESLQIVRKDLAGLDEKDDRTGLVLEPLRWAMEAIIIGRPYQAIVLEQVPAVLPVWTAFRDILRENGYSAEREILHTEEFGVPQTRRRAILIARWGGRGALLGGKAKFPEPTHRRYRKGVPRMMGDPRREPWVTMGDVLPKRGPFIVVSNYGTGGDPKARGRRRSDEPSATVTGKISRNRVIAPDGTPLDRFTNHEAGQLQTFSERHPWSGRAVAQQIGNAVPPRLGMHILAAALDLGKERLAAALTGIRSIESPIGTEGSGSEQD